MPQKKKASTDRDYNENSFKQCFELISTTFFVVVLIIFWRRLLFFL